MNEKQRQILIDNVMQMWRDLKAINGAHPPEAVLIVEHEPLPTGATQRAPKVDTPTLHVWKGTSQGVQRFDTAFYEQHLIEFYEGSPYHRYGHIHVAPCTGTSWFCLTVVWGDRFGRGWYVVLGDEKGMSIVKEARAWVS